VAVAAGGGATSSSSDGEGTHGGDGLRRGSWGSRLGSERRVAVWRWQGAAPRL
jgi:hypothetical protein